MASALEIWNAALAELAEDPVDVLPEEVDAAFATAALDPLDENEAAIAAIYPQVKEELLSAHPWRWLLAVERLVATAPAEYDSDNPATAAWAYQYRWHRPELAVGNLRAVSDSRDGRPRADGWAPQGAYIFTDFSPAFAAFQRQVAEEAWPQLFVNAVVVKLAARLAIPVKEDIDTARLFDQRAMLALQNAQRVDSQGHPSEEIDTFPWVEAHAGGYGLYGGRRLRGL